MLCIASNSYYSRVVVRSSQAQCQAGGSQCRRQRRANDLISSYSRLLASTVHALTVYPLDSASLLLPHLHSHLPWRRKD